MPTILLVEDARDLAQVLAVATGFDLLVVVLEAVVVCNSFDSFTSVFTALGLILLGLSTLIAVVLPFALSSYLENTLLHWGQAPPHRMRGLVKPSDSLSESEQEQLRD